MMLTLLSTRYKIFQYVHQRLRLHAASVKWRDQLLLAAVLVESKQHVAVCSSSDQPEIEHMSLVDTILQATPEPEVTWIQVRKSCSPMIWKTSEDITFICEGFTKQTLHLTTNTRWCAILHKKSCLKTRYVLARQESHAA